MTYAAEPYAQFVDDLLTALTGGTIRDEFLFLPEQKPFRLSAAAPVIPAAVRASGLANGKYMRFRRGTDFDVAQDGPRGTIVWQESAGKPAKDAVWPDPGSAFYVNYETQGSSPALTDRNPGSITRILAESFAREFATLSKQIEAVYEAGFVATAGGRDLEQLAALVGVVRRRKLSASGNVVFSRTAPSPADIFIPAGTKLSTADAPLAVFETTDDRTVQRGSLSVDAPVSATVPGQGGVVAANAIRVLNRPILGIDAVTNPQPTRLGGADETDDLLRARTRRALETAGKATTGSLLGALAALPGLREKDIAIAEDYLAHPGVVNLTVAFPELSPTELDEARQRAVDIIEATRPVGVRIEHKIDAPRPLGAYTPGDNTRAAGSVLNVGGNATAATTPVDVEAQLTPTTLSLSADERARLVKRGEDVVNAFLAEAGVGEVLVYNKLVAELMKLDGILDVAVFMRPQGGTKAQANVVATNPAAKPVKGVVDVKIGGALVSLDVALAVTLRGAALAAPDPRAAKSAALLDIEGKLKNLVSTKPPATLTVAALQGALQPTDTYSVGDLHYHVEYVEAGVRIHQQDVQLPLSGLERLWVRSVTLLNGGAA